ncbi:MAG: PEP-CTERM sorting domain-containing protein [Chthoniobacterales bacterium]
MKSNRITICTTQPVLSKIILASIIAVSGQFSVSTMNATARTWNNAGIDFNTATNWTTTTPGLGDVAQFNAVETVQPNLSASLSIAGLYFSGTGSSGYDLTNTNSAVLTLTGYSTTGSGGTSNSSAAAIRSEITSGTNTIDAPLVIAPAVVPNSSIFYQANGGTLVVNGPVSGGTNLSLKGTSGGIIQLNGGNAFATGSIDTAGIVVVVGNDSGLGSGTFSVNSTASLQAGGASRTLSNNIVLAGSTTLSGSNAFTLNGTVTSSGSNSRSLTVSNTGGAIIGGNLVLQEATATGRTFTILGTSAVSVNGVVQDGGTGPAILKYTGSSTLTLSNANTYSGGTQMTVTGSTIIANSDGALGAGNVTLTIAGATLTLQNGTTQNYISDSATLSLLTGDTVNLSFLGTDTVSSLIIDATAQAAGIYNATTNPGLFIGTGSITVVPEPSTYAMLLSGAGLMILMARRKRAEARI